MNEWMKSTINNEEEEETQTENVNCENMVNEILLHNTSVFISIVGTWHGTKGPKNWRKKKKKK